MQTTDNEQIEPPQNEPDSLTLNLAFASIDDLVEEILSRGRPAVVIYTKTDRRDEDAEIELSVNGGEGLTRTSYRTRGLPATIIGQMEIVKTDLIRSYFNEDSTD